MAGLGAMFIGMIGGGIAMLCLFLVALILAVIVFVDARCKGMKAVFWGIIACVFNIYSLPFYIYARVKSATVRCTSCGARVGSKNNFCSDCGAEVQKYDDGAFGKKVLKIVLIIFGIFYVVSLAYIVIMGILSS